MKSLLSILVVAGVVALSGYALDADAAKRLGGGKSSGMQRESAPAAAKAAPAAAPTATPAASAAAAPAAAVPKPAGNKWLGPLAGLAAGGLLASLFMGGGFGGLKMFDIVTMLALAAAAFFVFRWFMQRKAGGLQLAGAGNAPAMPPQMERAVSPVANDGRIVAPEIGSRLAGGNASAAEIDAATKNPRIPADFDVAPFEREARSAFIRLQAANDRKDLNDIRDFTTPEMYAEISLQLLERGATAQQTEVTSLNATVLEVVTENERAIASVRFMGTMREEIGGEPLPFDEVWHVAKNLVDKKATWQLAGIQQLT